MTEYEYETAIGIGILISQNSILKNRMILFSQTASWISLKPDMGFTETVKEIMKSAPPPTARIITESFNLIKEAILISKMKKDEINKLELVVISNFANETCQDHPTIKDIPNITYWNISQNMTIQSKDKNIKYIGGKVSLDEFTSNKDGIETMKKILSNPRYDKIRDMFTKLTHE
jgi:hypothetical protein